MNKIYLAGALILLSVFFLGVVLADPFGAEVTPGSSSNANLTDEPGQHNASAGNLTEMNMFVFSSTNTWQGYFGNVSGAITLSNSAGNAMYNWSIASPTGEVYASNDSTINWTSIDCFDMETNVANLEASFNVPENATDGVDETFNLNNHAVFTTAGTDFSSGICNNTKLFNDGGVGTFDVVLLEDADGKVVFTSLLLEDETGFDGRTYDFQMIVLEDGRGNTETTTYYFWLEIQ